MTTPGKNKSIYLDPQSLDRLSKLIDEYARRTGMRPSDSSVVCRAIEALFLAECRVEMTNSAEERQAA